MIVFCTGVDMFTTLHCLCEMQRLKTTVGLLRQACCDYGVDDWN